MRIYLTVLLSLIIIYLGIASILMLTKMHRLALIDALLIICTIIGIIFVWLIK